jgi:hypothetical protein
MVSRLQSRSDTMRYDCVTSIAGSRDRADGVARTNARRVIPSHAAAQACGLGTARHGMAVTPNRPNCHYPKTTDAVRHG